MPNHVESLQKMSQDERLIEVRKDLEKKMQGEHSYYEDIEAFEFAKFLGVKDLENAREDSRWNHFNAMERLTLDHWFEDQDWGGEDIAWFIESKIKDRTSWLPAMISEALIKKSAELRDEKKREEVVQYLGEELTCELEEILNQHELDELSMNGIMGYAIWSYVFPDDFQLRFEAQIGDLGEVESIQTPYDDIKGKFCDGPEYVVS